MRIAVAAIAASFFIWFACPSQAVTIWDNGAPALSGGGNAGNASEPNGQAGDNFTVSALQTANQVQWWGTFTPTGTPTAADDFTIRFFTVTAGVPAIVPFVQYHVGDVGGVDTGIIIVAGTLFEYSTMIPNTVLGPGDYLLSIINNTAADADDDWAWVTSNGTTGNAVRRNADLLPWQSSPGPAEQAFNLSGLDGAVPGPGGAVPSGGNTAMLLAMALVGLIVVQRVAFFSHER